MEKISVTRALSEIKLLKSRIEKEILSARFVDIYQMRSDLCLASKKTKQQVELDAKASFDSIKDLIDRMYKIKNAIMIANHKNSVEIGGKKYLVVEAIARKSMIPVEMTLIAKMKSQLNEVLTNIESNRIQLDNKLEQMLVQSLGTDKKTSKEDYDNIAKPFIEANIFRSVDPLNLSIKIKEMEEDINKFVANVDFALSESNSLNSIEI